MMKKNILPLMLMLAVFASCSSAYKTAQTPDDVYYSPGKVKEYATATTENRDDQYARNDSRTRRSYDDYEDYSSSSDDNYLRMKIQNRYQWDGLDDYDYWYSPNYAYNNYYGFNSFNPYTFNSWGLSYGYSPFTSIQPYSWFNSYYPSYGFGYGYSPYSSGFYGHNSGYGYYGYSPVNVIVTNTNRTHTSRPLLGAYVNRNYNNGSNNSNNNGRYVPAKNGYNRYNNAARYNNNNNINNNNTPARTNNTNTFTPSRSYTPSSSGSSSSGGGSVSRPVRH